MLLAVSLARLPDAFAGTLATLPSVAAHVDGTLVQANANGYVTLSTTHKQIVFVPDVRRVTINGIVLHMNAPYLHVNGTGQIATADVDFVLMPLIDETAGSPGLHHPPRIMLDPGHGGEDSGAVGASPDAVEKDIVLALALHMRELLAETGVDVRLTRENDRYVALDERADLANRWGADLFVSLHLNSSRNARAAGIETYVIPAAGFPSTAEGSKIDGPYPGNSHDAENTRLAYFVHKGLIFQTKASDRGIRRARFEVLRKTRCPALLAECGFISNKDESWLLRKEDYRHKVAQGLVSGILTYVTRREAATRPPLPAAPLEEILDQETPAQTDANIPADNAKENVAETAQHAPPTPAEPAAPPAPVDPVEKKKNQSAPPEPVLPPSALLDHSDAAPQSNSIAPSTVTPIE